MYYFGGTGAGSDWSNAIYILDSIKAVNIEQEIATLGLI